MSKLTTIRSGARKVGHAAQSVDIAVEAAAGILSEVRHGIAALVSAIQEAPRTNQRIEELRDELNERLDSIEQSIKQAKEVRDETSLHNNRDSSGHREDRSGSN